MTSRVLYEEIYKPFNEIRKNIYWIDIEINNNIKQNSF